MTMIKKFVRRAGCVVAAMGLGLSAQAATIQYTGGEFTTFNGFDWSSSGTAFTTGFIPVTGDLFTLTYFAQAVALQSPNFVPSGMDIIANGADVGLINNSTGFNWTIVSTLTERVTSCNTTGTKTTCDFEVVNGGFKIYYQENFIADSTSGSLGTGFASGIEVLSGTLVTPQDGGSFTANTAIVIDPTTTGVGGTGSASLFATIDSTNSQFISPDLLGTRFSTQLNFGVSTTEWTNPGGFAGTSFNQENIAFQADGNQTFTEKQRIPEPGSLALVSLALVGAGVAARRRRA